MQYSNNLGQLEVQKCNNEITSQQLVKDWKIIAHNQKMKGLIKYAEQIANIDSTVLILGETGTGKDLFARHIHDTGRRKNHSFISIYCPGISEELLESKLFPYYHGTFSEGTLFIDEVADLSLDNQVKLIQFLKERKSARIIASTNQNLYDMIEKGSLRKELYYRLREVEINIPPLRERPEDIKPIICFFLNKFNKKYNVRRYISTECIENLGQYAWPGNVRELENLIERLIVMVQENIIKPSHLPKMFCMQ